MSTDRRQQSSESRTAHPFQAARHFDRPDQAREFRDEPATLTARQLCRVLGISEAHYHRNKFRFRDLVQQPAVGRCLRYNRLSVERFNANEWSQARSFGRRAKVA